MTTCTLTQTLGSRLARMRYWTRGLYAPLDCRARGWPQSTGPLVYMRGQNGFCTCTHANSVVMVFWGHSTYATPQGTSPSCHSSLSPAQASKASLDRGQAQAGPCAWIQEISISKSSRLMSQVQLNIQDDADIEEASRE